MDGDLRPRISLLWLDRMTDRIITIQNSPLSLKRLAAMRVLYATAKQFFTLQLILSVPTVICIAIAALAFDKQWFGLPKFDIAWFVGASGGLFVILDICIWNPVINRRREKAAKIQQCFDCAVLNLAWNEIHYGKPPDHEDIEIWSKKYTHNPGADLENWYRVEVDALPHEIARLLCQRANCWWDMDLRHRYNIVVYVVGVFLLTAMVILAIFLNCSVETIFGLAIAPILPFFTIAPKLVQDNKDAIGRLQAMKEAMECMWARVLQGTAQADELNLFAEEIQIGIFNNRKNNPLIFDWVHRRAKPAHEETTSKSTEEYVAEYRAAHP